MCLVLSSQRYWLRDSAWRPKTAAGADGSGPGAPSASPPPAARPRTAALLSRCAGTRSPQRGRPKGAHGRGPHGAQRATLASRCAGTRSHGAGVQREGEAGPGVGTRGERTALAASDASAHVRRCAFPSVASTGLSLQPTSARLTDGDRRQGP